MILHKFVLFFLAAMTPLKRLINEDIQEIKFNKLLKERQPRQDPEKAFFNYSNISLSGAEESLFVKGLKFSIPPKKLNYADYLVNFGLFYRSIYNLDGMSNENLDFVKTKIKDAALLHFVITIRIFHVIFRMKNSRLWKIYLSTPI